MLDLVADGSLWRGDPGHEESGLLDFEYAALPAQVLFGPGAARARLTQAVDRLDARRVLVVVATPEEDLARELVAPFVDRLVSTFTGVRPHVPVAAAEGARA